MFTILWMFLLGQEVQETMQVRRVELDVRVFDLAQKPVMGLGQDAFEVKEGFSRMPVVGFEEVNYLDMTPGETYDAPRVLFLFNFMDDPRHVNNYITEAEDFFLYKDMGAWQVSMGYASLNGIFMVTPFTANQDEWIEGVNAIRARYQEFDQRALFANAPDKIEQDVTRRIDSSYGFQENGDLLPGPDGTGPQPNAFGQEVELFAQPANPALTFDPRGLSRFIRLLTTYYGIKEVLVLGNPLWDRGDQTRIDAVPSATRAATDGASVESAYAKSNATGTLSSGGEELGFDINETLTHCVLDRIRFSRLAFTNTGESIQDEFVTLCGGFLYPTTRTGVDENIERYLNQAGHFYRLAYQTELAAGDMRYRKVRVGVKGLTLNAVHVGRFYPALLQTENQLQAQLGSQPVAKVRFQMPWSALAYENADDQSRGQLALGKRIFLDHRLVFEQVDVLTPRAPQSPQAKNRTTNLSDPNLSVDMDLPVFDEGQYRVEFVAVDLLTGRSARLQTIVEL